MIAHLGQVWYVPNGTGGELPACVPGNLAIRPARGVVAGVLKGSVA
jgi:hypothetical protein